MLEFDEEDSGAQVLAIYYAKKTGSKFVVDFMSSKKDLISSEDAYRIAKKFWEMTDFAIEDNDKNIVIEGITDIEFWMYKLFNMVSGYVELKGYEKEWDKAKLEHGK
jgi:hypothetical protein